MSDLLMYYGLLCFVAGCGFVHALKLRDSWWNLIPIILFPILLPFIVLFLIGVAIGKLLDKWL